MTFEPPGKGEWRTLADHFPRPLTPEYQWLLRQGIETGEGQSFERYGVPAKTLKAEFVHGYLYIAPVPLVGRAANGLPPAPVLWLASRVVPAFRRRNRAAQRALDERVWLEDTATWYERDRPAFEAANTALDAVDPAELDDTAFVEHLRAVEDNAAHGYRTHFRLHGADLFPTALLLDRATEWDLPLDDVLALLGGASPASTGSGPLPENRLVTGYDVDSLTARELPPYEVRVEAPSPPPDTTVLRKTVPAAERSEFDVLVNDARGTYGLRDDNGLYTAAWPVGLLRRAMLDAGRRLEIGTLALEATVGELVARLRSASDPADEDLRARAQQRAEGASLVAPPILGPAMDLPLAALPRPMQRMLRALALTRDLGTTAIDRREALAGFGVGGRIAVGPACVASDPNEAFTRFEPGSILVVVGTTPAYNSLLAIAGGVVTEEGGALSHAAVMARELGIPAVIGAEGVLSRVRDGQVVVVDPVAGRVIPRTGG